MKKYTEQELQFALELQKAECYQKVGHFLIQDEPEVVPALDYLADATILSIEEIDEAIKAI